ncbi:hypothetical protein VTG60DRAFT_4774 [Thermothelomyces hinnuleus]
MACTGLVSCPSAKQGNSSVNDALSKQEHFPPGEAQAATAGSSANRASLQSGKERVDFLEVTVQKVPAGGLGKHFSNSRLKKPNQQLPRRRMSRPTACMFAHTHRITPYVCTGHELYVRSPLNCPVLPPLPCVVSCMWSSPTERNEQTRSIRELRKRENGSDRGRVLGVDLG